MQFYDFKTTYAWQHSHKKPHHARRRMTRAEVNRERQRAAERVNNEAPAEGSFADQAERFLYWRRNKQ